jgi:hypothetical protein
MYRMQINRLQSFVDISVVHTKWRVGRAGEL